MGTRADFYIAEDAGLDWLGSIAWDGYPDGIDEPVRTAKTGAEYRDALTAFFTGRDDVTLPANGWPWPWDTSAATDYGYVLVEGKGVFFCPFGNEVYSAAGLDSETPVEDVAIAYPDMSARKRVAGGSRSGIITISA